MRDAGARRAVAGLAAINLALGAAAGYAIGTTTRETQVPTAPTTYAEAYVWCGKQDYAPQVVEECRWAAYRDFTDPTNPRIAGEKQVSL